MRRQDISPGRPANEGHVGPRRCSRHQPCPATRGRSARNRHHRVAGLQHRHGRLLSETASSAQAQPRSARPGAGPGAGSARRRGPSRETRRPEQPGCPAPKRNPRLLGNRRGRRGLVLRSLGAAERRSRRASGQPPAQPASLVAALRRVAQPLPLALLTRLQLPRRLSAHLLQSQAPPKAGQPHAGHGLHGD